MFVIGGGFEQIYVEISTGTSVSSGDMKLLGSIEKWVEDTLFWATELRDRAEKYYRSLLGGLGGSEASINQIIQARKQFNHMWLEKVEEQIRELGSNFSRLSEGGPTIDEVEDRFFEIKPTIDLLDVVIDAIRALGIQCICETNTTMQCPVHEARKYTKDLHGIDGSMGEFDTI